MLSLGLIHQNQYKIYQSSHKIPHLSFLASGWVGRAGWEGGAGHLLSNSPSLAVSLDTKTMPSTGDRPTICWKEMQSNATDAMPVQFHLQGLLKCTYAGHIANMPYRHVFLMPKSVMFSLLMDHQSEVLEIDVYMILEVL